MSKLSIRNGVLPPLSEEQKQEIKTLSEMNDADIDTGDIPEVTEEFWQNAEMGRFYRGKEASADSVDVIKKSVS